MSLTEILASLQKEFKQKIVTGQCYDRGFQVDFSLDDKVKVGSGLLWHNIKNLCLDGYAVVLYNSENVGKDVVRATPIDEANAFKITKSSTPDIRTGPASYRDLQETVVPECPVVISGTKELDYYRNKKKLF
jgi:hypothetical protein